MARIFPYREITRQNVGDRKLACTGHLRLQALDVSRKCDVRYKLGDRLLLVPKRVGARPVGAGVTRTLWRTLDKFSSNQPAWRLIIAKHG